MKGIIYLEIKRKNTRIHTQCIYGIQHFLFLRITINILLFELMKNMIDQNYIDDDQ